MFIPRSGPSVNTFIRRSPCRGSRRSLSSGIKRRTRRHGPSRSPDGDRPPGQSFTHNEQPMHFSSLMTMGFMLFTPSNSTQAGDICIISRNPQLQKICRPCSRKGREPFIPGWDRRLSVRKCRMIFYRRDLMVSASALSCSSESLAERHPTCSTHLPPVAFP